MGYYEVFELLYNQLKEIHTKEEYYKKQKELALKTKDIALELDINIRAVRNQISKMLKEQELECLKGDKDTTEKYYILKFQKVKADENGNINIIMDVSRGDKPDTIILDNKETPRTNDPTH